MMFLPYEFSPCDRIHAILRSASTYASHPDVQAFAQWVAGTGSAHERAQRLLDIVSAPDDVGHVTASQRGQWIDTDIARVIREGGDCVSRTHALIALLRAIGISSAPVWLRQPAPVDHVVAIVSLPSGWQWADPLERRAQLGEIPPGYAAIVQTRADSCETLPLASHA